MSPCNFTIDCAEPIEQLIDKAKKAIISAKGTFEGDLEKGDFIIPTPIGKIEGNYKVLRITLESNSLAFEITDKPMLLGCDLIESELKKYLGVKG